MNDTDFHRQCKLSRQKNGKVEILVTWLPEEYAKVGKVLEIEMESGEWENGWAVCEVHTRKKSKEVAERERDHRKHRSVSDV